MYKKRKAFTLMELLVVVVIIGVLSAVVLPKFTKVIETRKTTEAEEMMAAVRNEQEARCSISKNYTDIANLGVYKGSAASKNFTYSNNDEGTGMIAAAKSGKYTLKMPSYADGRICCDDCDDLNKNYPTCSELKENNFVPSNPNCGAWKPAETCTETPCTETPCTLQNKQEKCPNDSQHYIFYTVNDKCEYDIDDSACSGGCDKEDYQVLCPQDNKHYIYYKVNDKCEYDVDNSQCAGCSTICDSEDEYVNSKCMCVPCKKYDGIRVNAARTSCEPDISIEDCKVQGKVFVYAIFPDEHGSWAECRTCEQFKGKKGKSKDGTPGTCEEAKACPETKYEECAEKGAQVIEWDGSKYLGEACYCNPCPAGIEFDSYGHPICACEAGTTLKECAAKGMVWNDQRHFGGGCACEPCSAYYHGEGTTSTGLRGDCSNCPGN